MSAIGCSSTKNTSTIDKLIESSSDQVNLNNSETTSTVAESTAKENDEAVIGDPNVDVDLSVLSATMTYAEIYNIMGRPDEYHGKTLKIKGIYYSTLDESDNTVHYILIEDALACCSQGIELRWDFTPDKYPEELGEITVTGVFNVYEKDGFKNGYLAIR